MNKELFEVWLRVTIRIVQTAAIESKDNMDSVVNLKLQRDQVRRELCRFLDEHTSLTEEAYQYLDKMVQERKTVIDSSQIKQKDERLALLESVHTIATNVLQPEKANTFNKLTLNAPKNVIYDLVRQLKNIYLKDGRLLPQSNEELAKFIVANIDGFENVSVSTVSRELGREQDVRKDKLKVSRTN